MRTRRWTAAALPVLLALAGAFFVLADEKAGGGGKSWDRFEISDLLRERAESGRRYHRFLKVEALHAGIYVLAAGGEDEQSPHSEDEIYYVLSGKARLQVDGEEMPAEAGDVLYVRAGAEHRFHSIEEELELLVFFASERSED